MGGERVEWTEAASMNTNYRHEHKKRAEYPLPMRYRLAFGKKRHFASKFKLGVINDKYSSVY